MTMRVTKSNWEILLLDDSIKLTDEELDKTSEFQREENAENTLHCINILHRKTLIDDHNGKEEKFYGYGILSNGSICPLFDNSMKYYGIYELYVGGDGKIHLPKGMNSSGVIYTTGDIKKDVENYNQQRIKDMNEHRKFTSKHDNTEYIPITNPSEIDDGIVQYYIF